MTTSKSTRRTVLTDDGEMRQVSNDPEDQPASVVEPAYCTRCGTANPADSNFCRKCGNSLVEQDAEMIGTPSRQPLAMKAKNAYAQQDHEILRQLGRGVSTFPSVIVELFTMMFVAGMAITAIAVSSESSSSWVAVIVLGAWFLVETVRRTGRRVVTFGSALIDIVTMIFVTGMVVAALAEGRSSAWVSVVVLLAWFLSESVRSYMPQRN